MLLNIATHRHMVKILAYHNDFRSTLKDVRLDGGETLKVKSFSANRAYVSL